MAALAGKQAGGNNITVVLQPPGRGLLPTSAFTNY